MKIKKIINQTRRDFTAIYVCEHCKSKEEDYGYDDDNFHRNVIPNKIYKVCGKKSPKDYRPMGTKYHLSEVV
jgi:hypothetical protein